MVYYAYDNLRSKRSRTERTKFGPREGVFALEPREKWGESKTVEGRGWGRGKKVTLARKPLASYADVLRLVTLASHADILRLVTRDKPKNVCVGG